MTQSGRITKNVEEAADVLLRGGIIGLPTETVYGLAALAENHSAVARVFSTKGRPTNHPLIVHLGTDVDPSDWGLLNSSAQALADRFWPGPLTLLVPRTTRVPDWVTGGRNTVALRVPSHPVAQLLLNSVATGVVAPSANLFGRVSPTTAQHVADDLGDNVDLILDGGTCDVGVESTIVECIENDVRILRPGMISAEDILKVVTLLFDNEDSDSRAPGMLASHYAPRASISLFNDLESAQHESEKLNKLHVSHTVLHYEDVNEYAVNLYEDLRAADQRGSEVVCAVLPPDFGVGSAIRDRLAKAAHTTRN